MIEEVKYTLYPYSPNTIENINKLVNVYNFFKDPTKYTIDYTEDLPKLTGIPYPDNCSFGTSVDKNIIKINNGRCFINSNLVLSRDDTILNLNRKKDYLIEPSTWTNSTIPTSNNFITYIIIYYHDLDKENFIGYYVQDYENIHLGFIEKIDYINDVNNIQENSIILGILQYDRDSEGRVYDSEIKFEDPEDDSIFITFIEPEIYVDEIDGGILKK